jgi:hypothetical protein
LTESEIEEEVIKNFVVKQRKARYLNLFQARKIGEWFGELAHFSRNLDLRFCYKIPSSTKSLEVDYIIKKIKEFSSETKCYIIYEERSLDGHWMNFNNALEDIIGGGRDYQAGGSSLCRQSYE